MTVTAARLRAVVTADTTQGQAGLKAFGSQVTTTAATTGGALSGMKSGFSGLGSTISSLGPVLGAFGVTLGAAQLAKFGQDTIRAASDASEALNKMQVVFGASSSAISSFAQTAASDLGMSKTQAIEAAGTFGNLFTSMGTGQTAAADMSQGLIQLAADLASFNNIPIDVMLEKLRAGMVGEVEPLRAVGINLSAAAVTAKALEMGLGDANDEVSQAGLLQARYALMLAQSTNAQGDFTRTSDGLANSMKIAQAQVEDMKVQLGELTIKPYTAVLNVAVTGLGNLNAILQKTSTDGEERLAGLRAQLAAAEKEIAGMGAQTGKGILGGLFNQQWSPEQIAAAKKRLEDLKAQIAYLESGQTKSGDVGVGGFQQQTSAVQAYGSAVADTTAKLNALAPAAESAGNAVKAATSGAASPIVPRIDVGALEADLKEQLAGVDIMGAVTESLTTQDGQVGSKLFNDALASLTAGVRLDTAGQQQVGFGAALAEQLIDVEAMKQVISDKNIGQQLMAVIAAGITTAGSAGKDDKDGKARVGIGEALIPAMLKSIDAQLVADASKLADKGAAAWDSIEGGFISQAQNSTAFVSAVNAMVDNSLARYTGAE